MKPKPKDCPARLPQPAWKTLQIHPNVPTALSLRPTRCHRLKPAITFDERARQLRYLGHGRGQFSGILASAPLAAGNHLKFPRKIPRKPNLGSNTPMERVDTGRS